MPLRMQSSYLSFQQVSSPLLSWLDSVLDPSLSESDCRCSSVFSYLIALISASDSLCYLQPWSRELAFATDQDFMKTIRL